MNPCIPPQKKGFIVGIMQILLFIFNQSIMQTRRSWSEFYLLR